MVGGTIRRKLIHRESFRASVLHLSEIQTVLQSIAEKKSVLTTPSLLSSGTRHSKERTRGRIRAWREKTTNDSTRTSGITLAGAGTGGAQPTDSELFGRSRA